MSTLYAARGGSANSNLYTVDPATGAMTSVGAIGYPVTGLAFDPSSGTLYGSTTPQAASHPRALISINTGTGAGTFIGAFGVGANITMADIAFDSAGNLYGYGSGTRNLYSIDKATGAGTLIGTGAAGDQFGLGFEIDGSGLGFVFPDGDFGAPSGGDRIFSVDLATGAVAEMGTLQNNAFVTSGAISAASFGPTSVMWFTAMVSGAGHTFLATVTPAGTVTSIGDMGLNQVDALAWDGGVKPNPWFFIPPPPATDTLYAARGGSLGTSDLYTVDPATGAMTSVGPIGYALTGLAEDPTDGTLYGLTSNNSSVDPRSLITIDKTTGSGTLIAACSPGTRTPWTDLAFDMFGTLYAFGQSKRLLRVNKATGAGTEIGFLSGSTLGGAISIRSQNVGFASPNGGNNGATLYSFTISGSFTSIGGFSGSPGGGIGAFAFDQSDVLYGAIGGTDLITVNTATAAVTSIGTFTFDRVDALTWGMGPAATDDFSVTLTPNALSICAGFDDTTALSTTITAGAAQSVTLSDTGAPAGVTLAYTTNPITSGAGTTVTVTVGGGAAPGIYSIIVHAVGTGATHTAGLTLTVPGPIGDAYTVYQPLTLNVPAPGVMTNDISPTTVSLNIGPTHGSLTFNTDGSFSYAPFDPAFSGVDTFVYNGHCGTATVSITVAFRASTATFDGGPLHRVAA